MTNSVDTATLCMKAQAFDEKFDAGEDVTPYLDRATLRRPNREAGHGS